MFKFSYLSSLICWQRKQWGLVCGGKDKKWPTGHFREQGAPLIRKLPKPHRPRRRPRPRGLPAAAAGAAAARRLPAWPPSSRQRPPPGEGGLPFGIAGDLAALGRHRKEGACTRSPSWACITPSCRLSRLRHPPRPRIPRRATGCSAIYGGDHHGKPPTPKSGHHCSWCECPLRHLLRKAT